MIKWILLAHVLGGASWFGAHVYVEGLMAAAARTRDPETIMTVGLKVTKTNDRVLGGAGFVTLIFGIWLVLGSVYDFEMIFVTVGFAVAVIGLVMGVFIFKPKGVEVEELVAERGLTDPEAMAKMKSLGNLGHVMTLLVTIAMILMVLKPGV
ncbi:MAG: hypothetical protein BMS9Abin12_1402 [Acidimicrobiia bacterium]|nr:MAG: hypothetical protein BMS9Abin12_1402 [Acidimicrobiia bacterium]